jgi:hypothetical protein
MWASEGCGEIRHALGVYLLGAISPADRSAVGRHLAGCAGCREELARLAGLPGLLGTVPAADVISLAAEGGGGGEAAAPAGGGERPVDGTLRSLLDRAAGRRRHRRWRQLAVTVAVVALAVGGAVAGSRVLFPPAQRPVASVQPWATTAWASNPRTGAGAIVRYQPQPWGLELDAQVSGVAAGTRCELYVVSTRGQEVAVGSWTVAGGDTDAQYAASSPFPAADVRGFAVTAGGATLVSIPIR